MKDYVQPAAVMKMSDVEAKGLAGALTQIFGQAKDLGEGSSWLLLLIRQGSHSSRARQSREGQHGLYSSSVLNFCAA